MRGKRRNGNLWKWENRIYVPCPASTKAAFVELARSNAMSEAELGLAIVEAAMMERSWLDAVIHQTLRNRE